jgi:hypothetical protein
LEVLYFSRILPWNGGVNCELSSTRRQGRCWSSGPTPTTPHACAPVDCPITWRLPSKILLISLSLLKKKKKKNEPLNQVVTCLFFILNNSCVIVVIIIDVDRVDYVHRLSPEVDYDGH